MKANKTAKNAAKQAKKNAKVSKALVIALDFKSNHRIRQRAADVAKVDLFALHAMKQGSRGYVQLCTDNAARVIAANKDKAATHVLTVGAVANKVTLGDDGFYSRAHGNGALVGNVEALRKLYGAKVETFAVSEIAGKFAGIKEEVTRRIGTGKAAREIKGREFAADGERFAMFAKLDNGTLVIHNGEFVANAHNFSHRAQTVKTTAAKADKTTEAAK